MNIQAQLEREVSEHNDLHANIVAGETQLASMKEDKQRRLGRIQLLQEQMEQPQQMEIGQIDDSEDS